ncbi:R-spondin precursor [Saccoglossus kowalevskii]|uniref:R-spondin n=1 Tax=Saccoglossus kowalevskii TaxID=10224 RepID=D1LXC5_SACKO|nr:R-spondin precursor [Saccoglossus kowalevskii]ACY92631.1 R-spondin [Saccoglossus kowalevskii]
MVLLKSDWLSLFMCLCQILSLIGKNHVSSAITKVCPRGCKTCSTFNGCITCRPRLFLLLHRSDMKHIGICTHACPIGFYGQRGVDMSRCYRCRVDNCEECFSRNFCTRCKSPYFLCNGECVESCPDGTYPDEKTGECRRTVDCEVATWSGWGMCLKMAKTCGFKWGLETRTREVLIQPTFNGRYCPTITESRQCRMKPRHCPDHINSSEPKPAVEENAIETKKTNKRPQETRKKKNNSIVRRRRRRKKERRRWRRRNRKSEKKRERIQKQTLTA